MAAHKLRSLPIRPVTVLEVPELLEKAISSCGHELTVSVCNVDDIFKDRQLLKRIKAVTGRNVRVSIWVLGADANQNFGRLKRLSAGFELFEHPAALPHFIVCDHQFALISNRPVIAARDEQRTFDCFLGYFLQTRDLIDMSMQTSPTASGLP